MDENVRSKDWRAVVARAEAAIARSRALSAGRIQAERRTHTRASKVSVVGQPPGSYRPRRNPILDWPYTPAVGTAVWMLALCLLQTLH